MCRWFTVIQSGTWRQSMKDAVSSLVAITPCSLCISFFQVYPSDDKLPLKLPLPEHTVSGLTPAVLVNRRGFKLHMLFSLHPEDIQALCHTGKATALDRSGRQKHNALKHSHDPQQLRPTYTTIKLSTLGVVQVTCEYQATHSTAQLACPTAQCTAQCTKHALADKHAVICTQDVPAHSQNAST